MDRQEFLKLGSCFQNPQKKLNRTKLKKGIKGTNLDNYYWWGLADAYYKEIGL